MEWIICLRVATIALAVSVLLAILRAVTRYKRGRILDPVKILFAGVVVASVALFIPIYMVTFKDSGCGALETFFISVHNMIRLFVVDGDYTFVLTIYNYMRFNGSGEQVYFLKVSNGKFQTLKNFDSMTRADGIRLSEGTFSSGSKLNGTIEPSGRKFTLTTNDSKSARKGKALWYGSHYGEFILEEREDGFYNLIFKTQECGADADDKIGGVCTRYVMEDGKLVLESQWFEANNGKVTYK